MQIDTSTIVTQVVLSLSWSLYVKIIPREVIFICFTKSLKRFKFLVIFKVGNIQGVTDLPF